MEKLRHGGVNCFAQARAAGFIAGAGVGFEPSLLALRLQLSLEHQAALVPGVYTACSSPVRG